MVQCTVGLVFPISQNESPLSRERLLTTPDPRLGIPRAFAVYQRSSFVGLVMLEVDCMHHTSCSFSKPLVLIFRKIVFIVKISQTLNLSPNTPEGVSESLKPRI